MAISFASVAHIDNGSANTTATTSSFNTVTGRFYMVAASANQTVSNITSTNGVTYTVIDTITGSNYLTVWGGVCSSGGSGTVTITLASNGITSLSVDEVSGALASGEVVQSAKASAKTVTLAALASGSATYLAAKNALTMTIETNWTQLTNSGTSPRLLSGYKVAGETTPSWTGTASNARIIGIEIAEAAAGAVLPSTMMMMGYGV